MKLRDARTFFRMRSSMIPVKMNMKSNAKYAEELWKSDDCMSMDNGHPVPYFGALPIHPRGRAKPSAMN